MSQLSISAETVTLSSAQTRELAEVVSGFLHRKQATFRELDHKSKVRLGNRQLSRLQQVIDRAKYTSLPDVQHFLSYTEELRFGDTFPTTLKNIIVGMVKEWNKAAILAGREAVYSEAILLEAMDSLTAITVLGKGDSNHLFFAHTANLDNIRKAGKARPAAAISDIRKWSKATVDVVSFDPPPAPVPTPVIPMMTEKEAQAKVRETEDHLRALKEAQAQLQIDAAITMPAIANGRDQQLDRRMEDAAGING